MPFQPGELTPFRSARHFYGAELRRFRTEADMPLAELARKVTASKSQLARIETAESMAARELSAEFDRLFGTDGHFARLYGLARRETHPVQYRAYMELEERAVAIDEYAGHTVPGLLQTEGYARALLRCDPEASEEQVERLVEARVSRQERMHTSDAPYLWAILDESVIRRPIGGATIMREQLCALIPLVDTATMKIQVLPYSHGEHALLGGMLALVQLPGDDPDVAYEEGIDVSRLYEDPREVAKRRRKYDALKAYALSPRESATVIKRAMKDCE